MVTSSTLILPRNATVLRKDSDKSRIVGMSTWRDTINDSRGLDGATLKKGSWKDYYAMYRQHSIVRSAIDKVAKTATNVGYDFVPRDSRTKSNEAEISVAKEFFSHQADFMGELRRVYQDLLIYGDAYLYIIPDRLRKPKRLKRLHPKTIHIRAKRNGEVVEYYQKDLEDISDNGAVTYRPHEILHFKLSDPDNDLYGLSPLESLKWAVAADLFAQKYNAAFFENSGVTGTIIGVKNADPAEIERNRKWLQEAYTGVRNAHKPLVIEGDSITIAKSVATHTEMGFLDGRKFIILEILAVLDVPPAKIGIMESANRSNSKEQDKTFRTESVSPLQYIVETVINDHFLRPILGLQETLFVHSEGDTRDAMEQMDLMAKAIGWGIMNVNEARGKIGMSNVEGGDINGIMTPTGFVPLDRMNLLFALPSYNTDKVPQVSQDPASGEPLPKPTPESRVATGSSRDSTKSFVHAESSSLLSLQGAIIKIAQARGNDGALRQAYSYIVDADLNDPYIANALGAIQKACATNDDILKLGYIERAQEALSVFVVPLDKLPEINNALFKPLTTQDDD